MQPKRFCARRPSTCGPSRTRRPAGRLTGTGELSLELHHTSREPSDEVARCTPSLGASCIHLARETDDRFPSNRHANTWIPRPLPVDIADEAALRDFASTWWTHATQLQPPRIPPKSRIDTSDGTRERQAGPGMGSDIDAALLSVLAHPISQLLRGCAAPLPQGCGSERLRRPASRRRGSSPSSASRDSAIQNGVRND